MLPAKAPSGLPVIDETWGGLYRGGAYLLHGRARSGSRLLALQFAQAAVAVGESCLFVSASPPEVLADRAARFGLKVGEDGTDLRLRVLHVASMADASTDDALEQALTDLTSLIRDYAPSRLVIDDFTPFTQFHTFERFATAFFTLLDRLTGATLILAMHPAADEPAEHLAEFVQAQMTGVIELDHQVPHEPGSCTLILRPGRFHSEGAHVKDWSFDAGPRPAAPRPQPRVPVLLTGAHPVHVATTASVMGDAPEASDDEPSGIHFFEFEESRPAGAPSSPNDPEQSQPPPSTPPSEPPPDFPSAEDPFAYALVDHAPPPSSTLFSALPTFLAQPPQPELRASMPRREFIRAFDASLLLHETTAYPFLIFGLRMEPGSSATQDFPLVVRGMRVALGDAYALLADATRLRLVALLPGGIPEDAPALFAELKQFLYDVTPDADLTFAETSAVLLPNGRPFDTSDAFLSHAFDS